MTSVAPPPPPPPPPLAGGLAPQLTLTFSSAPLALSQLALDSLLGALIKSTGVPGESLLQTRLGDFQAKMPFTLPKGTQVTFKVVQTEPALQLQLTHINNKAIAPNTPASRIPNLAQQFMGMGGQKSVASAGQNQTGTASTSGPSSLINLNTASGLRAFVLSTPTVQATVNQASAPGFSQPAQPTPNTGSSTPQPVITKLAASLATHQGNAKSAFQATALGSTGAFQRGNQLSVRLLLVQLPNQAQTHISPTNTASSSAMQVQGTVQGTTGSGQPLIKTNLGIIALDTTTKIPDGALIKLEVLSSSKPGSPDPLKAKTSVQAPLTKNWPALEEALATLRETNPSLAEQLSNKLIPRPDTRMAANIIFFLKALGRGTMKSWADDQTLRAIARSKPGLLKKLENDFSDLSSKAKLPSSTDWKIAYVPMQGDGNIQQIRIAQRDHKEENNSEKEESGVRFIIDLDLSQLGPMQFDGLSKEKNKHFDLIVRTKTALAGYIRKDIHDIFENAMEVIGFDGNILFQVTPRFIEVEGMEIKSGNLNLGMLV